MTRPICTIVGAGAGLGQALAGRFAKEGYDLALISRSEAGSRAALDASAEAAPDVTARHFVADATDPFAIERACGSVASDMGHPEVLIYNVRGPYTPKAPLEVDYEELDQTFAIEVKGALAAAKSVMPQMIERGHGTVLLSSATAALRGSATNPLYAIGKFGLRALSQCLAKAHSRDGVHVAHVRLDCTMDVPMVRAFLGESADAERLANPDDVADGYWSIHRQPRSAWSNEVELRPYTETWTC